MENKPFFVYEQTSTDLSIKFIDRSLGSPLYWVWEFGGTDVIIPPVEGEVEAPLILIMEEQNPTVTFTKPAIYLVKETVTFQDVDLPMTFERNVVVGMNLPIREALAAELPGMAFDEAALNNSIKKWQLYLQTRVGVSNEDVFVEARWPPLANVLIAKLLVYDELVRQANSFVQAGNTTRVVKGSVKKVETGPTNVEWNPPSESFSLLFKNKDASFIDFLLNDICLYARSLGILLPMCKLNLKTTHMFSIFKAPRRNKYPKC